MIELVRKAVRGKYVINLTRSKTPRGNILLAIILANQGLVSAFECTFQMEVGQTDYGPSLGTGPVRVDYGDGNGDNIWLAFTADQCAQFCCDTADCVSGAFNLDNGQCYLKGVRENGPNKQPSDELHTFIAVNSRAGSAKIYAIPTCSTRKGVSGEIDDLADLDALRPGINWWYDWKISNTLANQEDQRIEYYPMARSGVPANSECTLGAKRLLGFNEPNFIDQAHLSIAKAREGWADVMSFAVRCDIDDVVGPALNTCGDCTPGGPTNPQEWLHEFFDTDFCLECNVPSYAVHIYTCDIVYVHEQLVKYHSAFPNKRIWLTEIACSYDVNSMDDQVEFMKQLLPYLESIPESILAGYAWFQAEPSPGWEMGNHGRLIETKGSGVLTAAGEYYVSTFPPCEVVEKTETSASTSQNTTAANDSEESSGLKSSISASNSLVVALLIILLNLF
jgi:hypothetical protein